MIRLNMSGATKTAWDVLFGVANLCGMFCPGCQKMAWDVLSRDVLSGSHKCTHVHKYLSHRYIDHQETPVHNG